MHSYTVLIAALYKQVVALARGWRIQLALMSLWVFAKNGCGVDPLSLSLSNCYSD